MMWGCHRAVAALAVVLAVLAVSGLCASGLRAAEPLFDERGYRVRDIRSETTEEPPPGATPIDTAELAALVATGGAALVDVLPTAARPATLPADALWLPLPRDNIPGSLWLPDLGLPTLSPARDRRFRDVLTAYLGGRARPVVVYCLDRCWLSWNAVRRLIEWGIPDVRWYRAGTDAWTAAGQPTERAVPAVRPEEVW